MTNTSLPESNSLVYPCDKRYPRPHLFRALRWVLIKWWILLLIGLVGLAVYLLIALFSNVLPNQLLFLVQNQWLLLLLVFALFYVGLAISLLHFRAVKDEEREL